MATKKLAAVWRILTSGRSLEAKMKLMLYIRDFYAYLANDIDETAMKQGEVRTLQALRAVVDDKIEKKDEQTSV